jgi:hypothetical protein
MYNIFPVQVVQRVYDLSEDVLHRVLREAFGKSCPQLVSARACRQPARRQTEHQVLPLRSLRADCGSPTSIHVVQDEPQRVLMNESSMNLDNIFVRACTHHCDILLHKVANIMSVRPRSKTHKPASMLLCPYPETLNQALKKLMQLLSATHLHRCENGFVLFKVHDFDGDIHRAFRGSSVPSFDSIFLPSLSR